MKHVISEIMIISIQSLKHTRQIAGKNGVLKAIDRNTVSKSVKKPNVEKKGLSFNQAPL